MKCYCRFIFTSWLVFLISSLEVSAATFTEELVSPVTTDAAPLFLSSVLMSTFLYVKQKEISHPATFQAIKDRPLHNYSIIGDYYGQLVPNAIYVLGMGAHAMATDSNISSYRAEHMFKATFYAGLVVSALKYTVQEPRPNSPHERNSFPSGHTATAFAFASTVAMQHNVYLGTTALLMAGFTAYSRMNDGRHYLHDVMAGMSIGIGYGAGIYYSQRGKARFSMVPIIDEDLAGLRVATTF